MATMQGLARARAAREPRTLRLPTVRLPDLANLRQVVFTVGSFAAGTYAAWDAFGRPAGMLAVMVSGLTINWLMGDGGEQR